MVNFLGHKTRGCQVIAQQGTHTSAHASASLHNHVTRQNPPIRGQCICVNQSHVSNVWRECGDVKRWRHDVSKWRDDVRKWYDDVRSAYGVTRTRLPWTWGSHDDPGWF